MFLLFWKHPVCTILIKKCTKIKHCDVVIKFSFDLVHMKFESNHILAWYLKPVDQFKQEVENSILEEWIRQDWNFKTSLRGLILCMPISMLLTKLLKQDLMSLICTIIHFSKLSGEILMEFIGHLKLIDLLATQVLKSFRFSIKSYQFQRLYNKNITCIRMYPINEKTCNLCIWFTSQPFKQKNAKH